MSVVHFMPGADRNMGAARSIMYQKVTGLQHFVSGNKDVKVTHGPQGFMGINSKGKGHALQKCKGNVIVAKQLLKMLI
jgi:hypothetical protein